MTPAPETPFRPAFEAALRIFARVSEAIEAAGFMRPVLVGGAAVEFYSGSGIVTGDFDVVTSRQDLFESTLQAFGFEKPRGAGRLTRGWVHPDLGLGFEVVADNLLGGHADRDRVRLFSVTNDDKFAVISVEDLIADRMDNFIQEQRPPCSARPKPSMRFIQMQILCIWNNGYGKKRRTTMVSPTSPQVRNATSLEAFGRDLARRRESIGEVAMPRNDGQRRTPSKRALLKAIEATGARW